MEQFNIAEALKYAPKGLKLYSPIFGEVKFKEIDDDDNYNCIVVDDKYNNRRWFYEYGTFFPSDESNFSEGECLLFPSVNHRCWNNWQNTLFLESIGSVCVDTITGNKFILGEDGTYFSDNTGNSYHFLIDDEDSGNYLLNSRYASPEEAKEFFDELEKNGYEWDGKKVVKKKDKQRLYVGGNVYEWDGKDLKKEQNKPKFRVGDIIKHKPTGQINTIKKVCSEYYILDNNNILYFEAQDMWELVASKVKPTLEDKVTALEKDVKALTNRLDAIAASLIRQKTFSCPDKAGDCVTLKDMKS